VSADLRTILKLRVPVIVQIARQRMPVENILALGPGAILEFEKSADDELNLLVNNKAIGNGVAVKVGENFGLRLTTIGSAQQRVAALRGQQQAGDSRAPTQPSQSENAAQGSDAAAGPGQAATGESG